MLNTVPHKNTQTSASYLSIATESWKVMKENAAGWCSAASRPEGRGFYPAALSAGVSRIGNERKETKQVGSAMLLHFSFTQNSLRDLALARLQ